MPFSPEIQGPTELLSLARKHVIILNLHDVTVSGLELCPDPIGHAPPRIRYPGGTGRHRSEYPHLSHCTNPPRAFLALLHWPKHLLADATQVTHTPDLSRHQRHLQNRRAKALTHFRKVLYLHGAP